MGLSFYNYYENKILNELSFYWQDPVTKKQYPAMDAPLSSIKLLPSTNGFVYNFTVDTDNYEISFKKLLKRQVVDALVGFLNISSELKHNNKVIFSMTENIANCFSVNLKSTESEFIPKLKSFYKSDPLSVFGHLIVAMRKLTEIEEIDAFMLFPFKSHPKLTSLYHKFYMKYMHGEYTFIGSNFYVKSDKLKSALQKIIDVEPEIMKNVEQIIPALLAYKSQIDKKNRAKFLQMKKAE